jgi:hypothetical protein
LEIALREFILALKNRRIKMQMKQPQKPQQTPASKAPEQKKPQAPAPQQKQKMPGK